jgi:hypothetical protein
VVVLLAIPLAWATLSLALLHVRLALEALQALWAPSLPPALVLCVEVPRPKQCCSPLWSGPV